MGDDGPQADKPRSDVEATRRAHVCRVAPRAKDRIEFINDDGMSVPPTEPMLNDREGRTPSAAFFDCRQGVGRCQ